MLYKPRYSILLCQASSGGDELFKLLNERAKSQNLAVVDLARKTLLDGLRANIPQQTDASQEKNDNS